MAMTFSNNSTAHIGRGASQILTHAVHEQYHVEFSFYFYMFLQWLHQYLFQFSSDPGQIKLFFD